MNPSRLDGIQYATGNRWRAVTNSSERMKQLGQSGNNTQLDVSGGESKVRGCKEQCCTGTWNVRSMNRGKLKAFKQEMARVNTDIFRNQ